MINFNFDDAFKKDIRNDKNIKPEEIKKKKKKGGTIDEAEE